MAARCKCLLQCSRSAAPRLLTVPVLAKKGVNRSKNPAKPDLPTKTCVVCGLPFTWRKKWEKVWDDVKYCSERCRRSRSSGSMQEDHEKAQSSE
eukprot:jgi/Chrzof1/2982/Cz12g06260.t1